MITTKVWGVPVAFLFAMLFALPEAAHAASKTITAAGPGGSCAQYCCQRIAQCESGDFSGKCGCSNINSTSPDAQGKCAVFKEAALKEGEDIGLEQRQQGWLKHPEIVQQLIDKGAPLIAEFIRGQMEGTIADRVPHVHTYRGSFAPESRDGGPFITYEAEWDANKISYTFLTQDNVAKKFDALLITKDGRWLLFPEGANKPEDVISNVSTK